MAVYLFPLLFIMAQTQLATAISSDADREIYDSLLGCAAFHAIEAGRVAGDAAAAQQATSSDFRDASVPFGPNRTAEAAEADLQVLITVYRERLDKGEPRAMAEQWTALELACRDLYPARMALEKDKEKEPAGSER